LRIMNNYQFDMPYDNLPNRSPQAQRNGSLHRQPSRPQFEGAYGHLPSSLYAPEDHSRFDPNGYQMRNATIGGYGNTGYDMGGNNWNNGAFGQNNTLNGLGGSSRRPQSKGRAGLPSVCL
jgi:hypothetical protein